MLDQTLVWNTDSSLQVTSLTARLRDLAGVGSSTALTASDLWGQDDALSVVVAAHHWALEGETLAVDAPLRGVPYRFVLAPLERIGGGSAGVAGRAFELKDEAQLFDAQAALSAERTAGIGTWREDLRTGAVSVSDGLRALLDIPRHIAHIDIRAFDHPEDRDEIAHALRQAGDGSYVCDHRVLCAGARVRSVRERARTMLDERGVAIARVGTLIDITDFKQREAELAELALQDPLTRLPNRAALCERVSSSIARCERNDLLCAVLFIDLDAFKAINDERGHSFGDRVIASVADRLVRNVRASDMVARLGGDEFVILVDDLFSEEAALDAGRKLLRSLEEVFVVDGHFITLSASVGIAVYPSGGTTVEELLRRADQEMYAVKRNGGRGVKLACEPSSADRRLFAILENA